MAIVLNWTKTSGAPGAADRSAAARRRTCWGAAIPNKKVLLADDDPSIRKLVTTTLTFERFDVVAVDNGQQALEAVYAELPDAVILDVMMPRMTGIEVVECLRQDSLTRSIPILMLTASATSADRVLAFTAGADDYVIKPFDPIELIARLRATLSRVEYMRDVNPLTALPGNVQIQEELQRRVERGCPFALLYVDLDNFKAFNDRYGFTRGDEALKLAANCCRDAVMHNEGGQGFVGHVGGDDFAVIVGGDSAEIVAEDITKRWERFAPGLYDDDDLTRGYLEVPNRRKELERFPLVTVSIGIATNRHRSISSRVEATEIATEMKGRAKREQRSTYAIDRRRPDAAPGSNPELDQTRRV